MWPPKIAKLYAMTHQLPTVDQAIAHFARKLAFEIDPADVFSQLHADLEFALIDTRSQDAWEQGRIAAASHLPTAEIRQRAPQELPLDMPVVVYCWGPGCNGATKAALEFAQLGYQVKELIGGYEYWAREGYPVVNEAGPVVRVPDELTATFGAKLCDC